MRKEKKLKTWNEFSKLQNFIPKETAKRNVYTYKKSFTKNAHIIQLKKWQLKEIRKAKTCFRGGIVKNYVINFVFAKIDQSVWRKITILKIFTFSFSKAFQSLTKLCSGHWHLFVTIHCLIKTPFLAVFQTLTVIKGELSERRRGFIKTKKIFFLRKLKKYFKKLTLWFACYNTKYEELTYIHWLSLSTVLYH